MLRSFKKYIIENSKREPEWVYSVGFKLNGNNKKSDIYFIENKDTIYTETFDDAEQFQTYIESNNQFAEPRNELIYTPPHLIFKSNLGTKNIPIHFSEKYLCFKDKLIGLHAPLSEKGTLIEIYDKFKSQHYSKLSRFWIYSTSAETLVNLETTCKKEDLDSLPYPENEEYLQLSPAEKIIQDDVLEFYIHLGKQIDDNCDGSVIYKNVKLLELQTFGQTYCDSINSIYAKNGKSLQIGNVVENDNYIIYPFGFGRSGGFKDLEMNLSNDKMEATLKDTLTNQGAVFNKIIRTYKHIGGYDCIFFCKPKALKYWLKSIALKDASDTFSDLRKAGF